MGLDMFLESNSKKVCKAAIKASGGEERWLSYGWCMYWRKANAIHKWFVENVQYGEDDCRTYDVSVEKLIELRDLCAEVIGASKLVEVTDVDPYGDAAFPVRKVIEDITVAQRLLPTTSGFFFGSTEYDEYYLNDLIYTRDGIDAILENIEQVRYEPYPGTFWEEWREKGEQEPWFVTFRYSSSW